MNADGFWDDPKTAQKVIGESKLVRAQVEPLEEAIRLLEDATVGYELSKEAGDKDMLAYWKPEPASFIVDSRNGRLQLCFLGQKRRGVSWTTRGLG